MHGGCEKSHQIMVKFIPTTKKEIFSLAVCYFSLHSSCLLVFLVHSNLYSKFYLYFLLLFSTTFSTPFSSCFCADMLHLSMQLLPPLCAQMKPLSLTTQCLDKLHSNCCSNKLQGQQNLNIKLFYNYSFSSSHL